MYLTFQNRRIRDICQNERVGREALKDDVFSQLQARLAELVAATNLDDFPTILISRRGDTKELYVELTINWFLVASENKNKAECTQKKQPASSTSLKLLRIECNHDHCC